MQEPRLRGYKKVTKICCSLTGRVTKPSYFISDEPEGLEVDVSPSDTGKGRESPMDSSPGGLVVEPVESVTIEGEPGAVTIIEALKTDEHLSEPASGDLAKSGTFPVVVTTGVPAIEPIIVSATIKEAPKDVAEETIKSGAMTTMAPTPFGNIIVACKRPSFFRLFLT